MKLDDVRGGAMMNKKERDESLVHKASKTRSVNCLRRVSSLCEKSRNLFKMFTE